jgi:hypothetical protein
MGRKDRVNEVAEPNHEGELPEVGEVAMGEK